MHNVLIDTIICSICHGVLGLSDEEDPLTISELLCPDCGSFEVDLYVAVVKG